MMVALRKQGGRIAQKQACGRSKLKPALELVTPPSRTQPGPAQEPGKPAADWDELAIAE
jgi:hypothetical protein